MSGKPSSNFSSVVRGALGAAAYYLWSTTGKQNKQDAGVVYLVLAAGVIVVFTILTTKDSLIGIFTETMGQDPNGEHVHFFAMCMHIGLSCTLLDASFLKQSISVTSGRYCMLLF
jgi:hypothetical protein